MGSSGSKPGSSNGSSGTKKSVENVAIIGGGIAGMTCAYYLAKKGIKVCVYERNMVVGGETSYGPAGVTMWHSVKKKFDLDGTVDLTAAGVSDALSYLEGAAWAVLDKRSGRSEMMAAARRGFQEFLQENPDASSVLYDDGGLLYLLDKKHFEANKKKYKGNSAFDFYTWNEFQKQKDLYDPLFDGVDVYGVLHSKEEGYVDPQRTVAFLSERVRQLGGEIREGNSVERMIEKKDGVQLEILGGSMEPKYDACIIALGAFPAKFLKASGYDDDVSEIYGMKGYSVTGRMPHGTLRRGVVDGRDTKFIRPFVDKNGTYCVRFGGIADPYDADDPFAINWDRMKEFAKNDLVNKLFEANNFPREMGSDTVHDVVVGEGQVEVWTGVRPVNKHGRVPLIRDVKGSTRSMVVSGFGSNGFVWGWYTGPKVAALFDKAPPSNADLGHTTCLDPCFGR